MASWKTKPLTILMAYTMKTKLKSKSRMMLFFINKTQTKPYLNRILKKIGLLIINSSLNKLVMISIIMITNLMLLMMLIKTMFN